MNKCCQLTLNAEINGKNFLKTDEKSSKMFQTPLTSSHPLKKTAVSRANLNPHHRSQCHIIAVSYKGKASGKILAFRLPKLDATEECCQCCE